MYLISLYDGSGKAEWSDHWGVPGGVYPRARADHLYCNMEYGLLHSGEWEAISSSKLKKYSRTNLGATWQILRL
jgi:hypothetical protein